MSVQGSAPGEALVFKVVDPDNPGQYLAQCSINTERSVQISPDIYLAWLADCADASKPKTPKRIVKGVDITFNGAGVADPASAKYLMKCALAGLPVPGKLIQDIPEHGWTITADWVIGMELGGTQNELQNFTCNFSQAGAAAVSYDGE